MIGGLFAALACAVALACLVTALCIALADRAAPLDLVVQFAAPGLWLPRPACRCCCSAAPGVRRAWPSWA